MEPLWCSDTPLCKCKAGLKLCSRSLEISPPSCHLCIVYHQLRARRALGQFSDVLLRTRMVLLQCKVYGVSTLLPFWLLAEDIPWMECEEQQRCQIDLWKDCNIYLWQHFVAHKWSLAQNLSTVKSCRGEGDVFNLTIYTVCIINLF